ncbi:DBR1-domain-containing protein [Ceratobasidium sp. AG-I]|nr:DBR1-domain-containing protein [Ceratobasidium sp. AG-I]
MKVAVAGCCHGALDATYKQVHELETQNNYKIDLVLINGDFQAVRNHQDLECMASPDRHKKLGDFYKYYTGEATAPVLTLVVGGNHEASNYMWELYHGGWLAPNIYYLGGSGCVGFGGLRIAGVSGIYKSYDYRRGHHEHLPYKKSDVRSAYHTRLYDVIKLWQLSSPDVFMSHDWPVEITKHGDLASLLKEKPHFRASVEKGELGSPPMMDLLWSLRPAYWFSAHMHCKFEAIVYHEPGARRIPSAPELINHNRNQRDNLNAPLDEAHARALVPEPQSGMTQSPDKAPTEDESNTTITEEAPPSSEQSQSRHSTHFLALDRCVPGVPYMHVLDIVSSMASSAPPLKLTYDREWLAISRALHPFLSTTRRQTPLPPPWEMAPLISESQRWVDEHVGEQEISHVQQFVMTAPGPINTDQRPLQNLQQPPRYENPQTEAFCQMLGLENKVNPPPT